MGVFDHFLLNIMEHKDATIGLATMCVGLGQGHGD